MYSEEEFLDKIEDMIPEEIQEALDLDEKSFNGFVDFINIREKAIVFTIKQKISSTHKWCKAVSLDNLGHKTECYWCSECGLKASAFDHINCLSVLSKVEDNLPTYTVHNSYLMFTCDEVKQMEKNNKSEVHCLDCGIPEIAKTTLCYMRVC